MSATVRHKTFGWYCHTFYRFRLDHTGPCALVPRWWNLRGLKAQRRARKAEQTALDQFKASR